MLIALVVLCTTTVILAIHFDYVTPALISAFAIACAASAGYYFFRLMLFIFFIYKNEAEMCGDFISKKRFINKRSDNKKIENQTDNGSENKTE